MKIKISREEVLKASGELANDNLKEFVVFETEESAVVVDEPVNVSEEVLETAPASEEVPAQPADEVPATTV